MVRQAEAQASRKGEENKLKEHTLRKKPITINFEGTVPQEVRWWVVPILKEFECVVPSWVEDFSISYDPLADAAMEVRTNYRNRWVVLVVTGHSMTYPHRERRASVLHELSHALTCPLTDLISEILETVLEKDSPQLKLASKSIDDGTEAVVEDMARAFLRVIEGDA